MNVVERYDTAARRLALAADALDADPDNEIALGMFDRALQAFREAREAVEADR